MKASSSRVNSFTLVELLVAVTILSFMLLMMAHLTGMAQQLWGDQQNRIDNFTKARSMLDLIAGDLQRGIFRGDLPIFGTGAPAATTTPTGDGLYYFTGTSFTNAFYTRRAGVGDGTTPVRDVSLVSYALNSTSQGTDKIVLQRSDLAVPWSSAANLSFQGDITSLISTPPSTAREMAPGVVGFRLAFRRADGSLVDQSQYTGYSLAVPANPVVAVDVGLAVIGSRSLALLTTNQIQKIQTALATATLSNGIKATWDQQVLTTAFYAPYPKSLAGGLKTFERWVACPPF